jgi:hypothetical protein
MRVTFFHEIHHPCPQFHWMGFTHVCLHACCSQPWNHRSGKLGIMNRISVNTL